jgi:hypothetical protein
MTIGNFWRNIGSALLVCTFMLLAGCDTFTTSEPMGRRIDIKDKKRAGLYNFDALMTHVWVDPEKKNPQPPFKFERQEETGFSAAYLDTPGGPVFQGFARHWEDRLILHFGCVNQKLQRPMLMFFMVKVAQDKEGKWTGQIYLPRKDAFKETRKTKSGEEVKLEFYPSSKDSELWIKSDEATLAKYFSTCKPDDLFKTDENSTWKGMTADAYRASKVPAPSGVRVTE